MAYTIEKAPKVVWPEASSSKHFLFTKDPLCKKARDVVGMVSDLRKCRLFILGNSDPAAKDRHFGLYGRKSF
jgi:hypothetical protein